MKQTVGTVCELVQASEGMRSIDVSSLILTPNHILVAPTHTSTCQRTHQHTHTSTCQRTHQHTHTHILAHANVRTTLTRATGAGGVSGVPR